MEKLVRIKYSKDGPLQYISHLNLVQVFSRTLRRADIPVVISGGFNPRFKISFGPPLPLGISSNSEYLDLKLKEAVNLGELKEKINQVSPLGLKIIKAREIPLNSESLTKIIDSAAYLIILKRKLNKDLEEVSKRGFREEDFHQNKIKEENLGEISPEEVLEKARGNIRDFLSLKEIRVEKQTPKGTKNIDTRPLILKMEAQRYKDQILKLELWLSIGPAGNLNPRYVIGSWLSSCGDYDFDIRQIYRKGLYARGKAVI